MPATVYIGPVEIAGQYAAMADALRAQGVPCHVHLKFDHPFYYPTDGIHPGAILRAHRAIIRYRGSNDLPRFPHRIALELARRALAFTHGVVAITRYRVFVFAFATTLAPGARDLPLLRLLGKRVIVVASNGSESRAPYCCGAQQPLMPGEEPDPDSLADQSRRKRALLRRIERWADVVVGAPLGSSPMLARPFVNYFRIGMPRPRSQQVEMTANSEDHYEARSALRPTRILHAPSHPRAKGTDRIRLAVESLRSKGYEIEYTELTNAANAEVLAHLHECDFVIDQLYSDTPMATFAAEAADVGRPSVVGGYGWGELHKWVPDAMWPPSQICHPDGIEAAIERLIADSDYRRGLGSRAQQFVATRWCLDEVGARWRMVIEDRIPPEWLVDPLEVMYLQGAAQDESQTRRSVQLMLQQCGAESLQLGHNRRLEAAYVEFASGTDGPPNTSQDAEPPCAE